MSLVLATVDLAQSQERCEAPHLQSNREAPHDDDDDDDDDDVVRQIYSRSNSVRILQAASH